MQVINRVCCNVSVVPVAAYPAGTAMHSKWHLWLLFRTTMFFMTSRLALKETGRPASVGVTAKRSGRVKHGRSRRAECWMSSAAVSLSVTVTDAGQRQAALLTLQRRYVSVDQTFTRVQPDRHNAHDEQTQTCLCVLDVSKALTNWTS